MERRELTTPAGLRCTREGLGLTARALAAALGIDRRTVTRWESGAQPISQANADALARLVAFTRQAVDEIVAGLGPDATIVTYRTDGEFQASRHPASRHLPASWHRMVAWRAAQRVPGATVTYFQA